MRDRFRRGRVAAPFIATLIVSSLLVDPAGAAITSSTGDIQVLPTPPASVQDCNTTGQDPVENSPCLPSARPGVIFAFAEQTNVAVVDLRVDLGTGSPGYLLGHTYTAESELVGERYSLSDTVNSYFLHGDLPFSDPATTQDVRTASITFSEPVLGVQLTPRGYGRVSTSPAFGLTGSDSDLGAPGTEYPLASNLLRGIEFTCGVGSTSATTGTTCTTNYNDNHDSFTFVDPFTIEVTMKVGSTMDAIRVITEGANGCTAACVSIGDATIWEGDAKSRSMQLPVTLSEPNPLASVTVEYTIGVDDTIGAVPATPGTARTPAVDFNSKNGVTRTLTFKPNQVVKSVTVPIFADAVAEPTETLAVTLSNPSPGYDLGRGGGIGTILDEDVDAGTLVSAGDAAIVEGDATKRSVAFRVTLSKPANGQVSIDYRIEPVGPAPATGGYTRGAVPPLTDMRDFSGAPKTIVFKTGASGFTPVQKSIPVTVFADTDFEGSETFRIVLLSVDGPAILQDAVGVGTILDDD
jgi:hypothetical protein